MAEIVDMKKREAELQKVLEKGVKAWNRSKIMILGEGRAGKTALSNSLMGKPFEDTNSTIGINEFTCDVKFGKLGNGEWNSYEKPEKELEMAVAKMIQDHRLQREPSLSNINNEEKQRNDLKTNLVNDEQLQIHSEFDELANLSSLPSEKMLHNNSTNIKEMEGMSTFHQESLKQQNSTEQFPLLMSKAADISPIYQLAPTNEEEQANLLTPSLVIDKECKVKNEDELFSVEKEVKQGNNSDDLSKIIQNKEEIKESKNDHNNGPLSLVSELDNELVAKCLTEEIQNIGSKLIISLYDFGGQSVFNVIHPFFLTRYAVYVIVFNMEWLVNGSSNPFYEECLLYLNFWINSVVIHTFNSKTKETAPILFIGTRKDKINSVKEHQKISLLLYEKFKHHICWPFVIENNYGVGENGRVNLWFFPINNKEGRKDNMLINLMKIIEETMEKSDYVHEEKPLIWLKTVDTLRNLSKSFLTMKEMEEIAKSCEIPALLLPEFLLFLHEMGYLMWHNESELRDIIILDPITYFVKPSTLLICKHQPTEGDPTHHLLEIHKLCRKIFYEDWHVMLEEGIVSNRLLNGLLQNYDDDHRHKVILLMRKHGLIVPLSFQINEEDKEKEVEDGNEIEFEGKSKNPLDDEESISLYLVPALLPSVSSLSSPSSTSISTPISRIQQKYQHILASFHPNKNGTFYFIFTTSKIFEKMSIITYQDINEYSFLPSGFFERLTCKAISWCQGTSSSSSSSSFSAYDNNNNDENNHNNTKQIQEWNYEDIFLAHNEAILSFGNQRFHLIHHITTNTIQVNIEGQNPHAIHERLLHQIKQIIEECMKYLKVFTVIPYYVNSQSINNNNNDTLQPNIFIKLSKILQSAFQHTELTIRSSGIRTLLSQNEKFTPWIEEMKTKSFYDLFISYRWGSYDSMFVQGLYDTCTLYNLTKQHRAINIFLDKYRLQNGKDFSNDFIKGLFSSKIIIPILSMDSLQRLIHHNHNQIDNLLLEWLLAWECYQHQNINTRNSSVNKKAENESSSIEKTTIPPGNTIQIRRILPIFIGKHQNDIKTGKKIITNLFNDISGVLEDLPDIIPTATVQKVITMLKERSLIPSKELQEITIKQLISNYLNFLGIQLWEYQSSSFTMSKRIVEKILGTLRELIHEEEQQQEREREEEMEREKDMEKERQKEEEKEKERQKKENTEQDDDKETPEKTHQTLKLSPNANNNNSLPNNPSTPISTDYSSAWKLLHSDNVIEDGFEKDVIRNCLIKIGVNSEEDLQFLESEDISYLLSVLKKVPQKKLKIALNFQ
jgi:GTPase SAR1 family protein